MTEREQRSKTITLLIAAALVILAMVLHNSTARAGVTCRLITVSYPKMQMSLVSKECWGAPAALVTPPKPRDKPCRMKNRVRWQGGCWIAWRINLMHKRK